ncbi:carboxylate-amine ligase [Jannaschia seohaensis]|uniref:Putative glutamate--cysteine ligase 2 n=1 Tax=Jannaschia seohaensis TaxID=475081 RepID=A0A2Y9AG13_9RHOB|nr:carboxylate-amine ligase [Jannaschia seohaensis]PWJ21089.1 carboxylate-amine ligase [Jannaschia seohaensis]SSA41499.1 carboxylate-amine ligase [Jannaschia seohaensis]
MAEEPPFTIGIEEEYLLVDAETGALAEAPAELMDEAQERLGKQVSPEFLQCQIEVGTGVCASVAEARTDLANLRRTVADLAGRHGLAPIAASCHPFSDWRDQHFTDRDRYRGLARDLRGVADRMLICGMHVHVGIPAEEDRIDLMGQMAYFLPHLLAMSGSSPFWQGQDTGLSSYRLTVFDNMPRTGLPPLLSNWSDWRRSVETLAQLGVIEDGTKIWWDLRPSDNFPTLETRICDICPRIEDALTLAALLQCTHRMLWRLKQRNQRWRVYDRFLLEENRWRAMRHGVREGLIDFGRHRIIPLPQLVDEWLELIAEDADQLGCQAEVARARALVRAGNASDRQREIFEAAGGGAEGGRAVVRHLMAEYREGL